MERTRKKVLFLITKSTLGGAQRYVYDLAVNLPADAFDVEVAVGGDGPLTEMLREAGIKVYTLSSLKRDVSLLRDVSALFGLIKILKKAKPDVLHLNSSKASAIGALAGRLCLVPRIIFTAHGWAFNEDRPLWQKNVFKLVHWITILLSHVTIAVSHGMRSEMTLPFIKKKMVVVHLGRTIPDMRYKDDARGVLEMKVKDTRARLIDYHDDLWLGTIAELHPIKRLNRAINAVSVLVKEVPNLRFIIIHDGSERERLTEQVRDLGLEEHVFFTGTIEDAARLLPAFDLFVLPSKSEAFGYVLIEAGLAGLPVVATRVGGIPDIITDGVNGLLVPPDNTPALTDALRRMIKDEDFRLTLARNHTDKARTFTLEKMVSETVTIYNK
jgi:glycosyltransferase involved in cell wall biosynthesis